MTSGVCVDVDRDLAMKASSDIPNADLVRDSAAGRPGWDSPGKDLASILREYCTTEQGECLLGSDDAAFGMWRVLDRVFSDEHLTSPEASDLITGLQIVDPGEFRRCIAAKVVEGGEVLKLASTAGTEAQTERLIMALRHDVLDRVELNRPDEAIALDIALDHLKHAADCSRRARAAGDDEQRRAELQASREAGALVLKALRHLADIEQERRREGPPDQAKTEGDRWG